jgi:hypothetical protein
MCSISSLLITLYIVDKRNINSRRNKIMADKKSLEIVKEGFFI